MTPSAQRDGQIMGFTRGFRLLESNWESDFEQSVWTQLEFEREASKERFRVAYLSEFEKGIVQRGQIEQKLHQCFREVSLQDQAIQAEYLAQILDIFYRTSFLFQSWKERIEKEVFPKNDEKKTAKEIRREIIQLIESNKLQQSLHLLKVLFLEERNSPLYHEVLSIDAELHRLRLNRKMKEIRKDEYQNGWRKIETQLLAMKEKMERED